MVISNMLKDDLKMDGLVYLRGPLRLPPWRR